MNFKKFGSSLLMVLSSALVAPSAMAFVHISLLKPHLPVSPEQATITFQWNGDAPRLKDKADVLDGQFVDASDAELMEALLAEAMSKWNKVESSYLDFQVVANAGIVRDDEDEVFAIVVEDQDSFAVAAAALPMFNSQDPGDSPNKKNKHIIYDCDISVSSSAVSAKELLRTLVHELGHCVGLGHPHSNYKSIMSYSNGSGSAELGLDDKAGVSFLYPAAGVSQDVKYLTSCGSISLGTSETPYQAGLVLLLPLLILALEGFRRPR